MHSKSLVFLVQTNGPKILMTLLACIFDFSIWQMLLFKATYIAFKVYWFMHSLGVEPMSLELLAPCCLSYMTRNSEDSSG